MKKEALVKILVSLMQNPSSCPAFLILTKNDFNELLKIAHLNKATTFLSHFLDCQRCQSKLTSTSIKKLNKSYTTALAQHMINKKEKETLGNYFRQRGLNALILKDFSSYPKLYSGKTFITSADIDLLIKKKDLNQTEKTIKKLGYCLGRNLILKNPIDKKTFLYQEKSFFKKRGFFSTVIDLHLQIAIPNSGEFKPVSKKVIQQLTTDVFKDAEKRKGCFFEPEIEYLLIFLIVHYFSSDLCTCLRNLFDIVKLSNLYEDRVDWKKFLNIAKQYKLERVALFVILLGSRVFKIRAPKALKFSPLLNALAYKKSLQSIAIFPPNNKWDKTTPALEKLFRENFFFKIFLTKNVRLKRMIKPRIIVFFMSLMPKMLIFRLRNFFSCQPKLF